MNYAIVTNIGEIDSIDFIPTIIVGFYQCGEEKLFSQYTETLKARFPDVDIIGCSSESNIYDSIPYVDIEQTHTCIFMCIEMKKESYMLQFFPSQEKPMILLEENKKYGAIVLSSHYSDTIENIIRMLQENIGKNNFFGAIAGAVNPKLKNASVFYNGKYSNDGILVWLIDQEKYSLKGLSTYDFDPVGFNLEITRAEEFKIIEIENKPALDAIEELIGTYSFETVKLFDQPFFITSSKGYDNSIIKPISSVHSIDKENKTITLYKKVFKGDKLKLAIPYSREKQIRQLDNFYDIVENDSIAFLFACVGYKGHWGEMEPVYIMRLAKNIQIPFIGFHAYGEIGPSGPQDFSVLQNQTLTLATLSEK